MIKLEVEPLTQESFAAFGDVLSVERSDNQSYAINDGYTQRHHALSSVGLQGEGGILSIFETKSFGLPLKIRMLERHPFGSQSFMPIGEKATQGFLIVVAEGKTAPDPATLRAFAVPPGQGVNFHANVWHHPNIVREGKQAFLVVDRAEPSQNLEEFFFPEDWDFVLEG